MAAFPMLNLVRYGREYATDLREGITTRSSLAFPTYEGGENYPYQPITTTYFRQMVQMLPIDPSEFTFVDLGCGKGTALFLALRMGFQRAIGVEIVPELLQSAEDNRASSARRNSNTPAKISLVLEDAGNFELPPDPTVLFLYNPFGESTFGRVLGQIERSSRARSTPVYVLYFNPTLETLLESTPVLQKIGRSKRGAAYRAVMTAL